MAIDSDPKTIIEYTIQAADFYGVPRADALRIAAAESSMGANTANYKNKDYVGTFQLGEAAAKDVGVTDRNDVKQNIFGGVAYYKQMLDANQGDRNLALASYNAGLGKVKQAGGDISKLPVETQNYVRNTPNIDLTQYGVTPSQIGSPTPSAKKASVSAFGQPLQRKQVSNVQQPNIRDLAEAQAKERLQEVAENEISSQLLNKPTAASPSMFSVSNIGSSGNVILPAAGAYGMYDLFGNDRRGGRAVIQGTASGAALGSYFGPLGAAVGAGVGTLLGGGAALMNRPPKTKKEEQRWQRLANQGLDIPDWVQDGVNIKAKDAGYRADLPSDFIGVAPTAGKSSGGIADEAGSWVNNPFAKTRDEKYLTGKDIWGYAVWAEKLGNSWMTGTPEQREAIADEALKRGLVDEAKGTINIKNDPEFWKFAESTIKNIPPSNSVRTAMTGLESGRLKPVTRPIA